ncbi:MAG: hypothetical protein IBJ11_00055 [Phycisphaerales bacterium]|nr:hypothetical protein [Phycisphaerales bacterium]
MKPHAGRFPPAAFAFVQGGLRHTVERIVEKREQNDTAELEETDGGRHVSGQELCIGLREYALSQFGRLARTVLASWGIRRTEDFGRIVFILVEAGLMRKTDSDSIEDFEAVYEFDEAFGAELGVA